jgi:hypothetical protein
VVTELHSAAVPLVGPACGLLRLDAELLGEDDPPADDEPTLATPGACEPLHAAASRVRAAVAMMAAAVGAVRSDARRGRRTTRVLSFIMPPRVG